jgi:metal-responsive CopG/Arc/MetJ family transcriptional regulator
MKPRAGSRVVKRGAYRRAGCEFIGAWVPKELLELIDQFVQREDLDRSKMLRRAIEEKLRRIGKEAA